jgi:hypothetical protein
MVCSNVTEGAGSHQAARKRSDMDQLWLGGTARGGGLARSRGGQLIYGPTSAATSSVDKRTKAAWLGASACGGDGVGWLNAASNSSG